MKKKLKDKTDFISSPLLRCQETANISVSDSKKKIVVDDIFRELPSPIKDLNKRVEWLKRVLPLNWEELEKDKESKLSNIDYYLWRKKNVNNQMENQE